MIWLDEADAVIVDLNLCVPLDPFMKTCRGLHVSRFKLWRLFQGCGGAQTGRLSDMRTRCERGGYCVL